MGATATNQAILLARLFPSLAGEHRSQRTEHRAPTALNDVSIDLRGPHVGMPELLLNGADIHTAFEQVGGK